MRFLPHIRLPHNDKQHYSKTPHLVNIIFEEDFNEEKRTFEAMEYQELQKCEEEVEKHVEILLSPYVDDIWNIRPNSSGIQVR